MHKALLKEMRSIHLAQSKQAKTTNSERKIKAEVIGKSMSPLNCPIQRDRSYVLTGDLQNMAKGKVIRDIEFLIDTGCQFAVVIPSFVADQIGLDEASLVKAFNVTNTDGSVVEAPTYNILLTINGIPIRTTVAVSGTNGEKALIGAELFSLFDLSISGDTCRLSLRTAKSST